MKKRNFTPETIEELGENEVFVFGSNMNGNHAGGAARLALDKFGAISGKSEGLQGKSYAIPTLDKDMEKVSVDFLTERISDFIRFTRNNQKLTFYMTKIGCGIAGFTVQEVSNIFKKLNFPLNVCLPKEFCVTKGYKVFYSDWSCRNFKYKVVISTQMRE